jgi:predicted Holliday junction resolvase-like endonuclease
MRAEQASVGNMIKIIELCPDCPLRELHTQAHEFIRNDGIEEPSMGTILTVQSRDNEETILVEGAHHNTEIIDALEECVEPERRDSIFQSHKVICGAVASLRTQGR